MNKVDVIVAAMRNIGDFVLDGVPASLTGSSIDHLNLIYPLSQQMQGFGLYFYSGAGAGQERIVGSFNATNHRMIFPQAFASVPSVNSNFLVSKRFPYSDYKNAVERSMGVAREKFLVEKVATQAMVATQFEYPVPSGMEYINTLRLVPSANSDYSEDAIISNIFEIPSRVWHIERNVGGSYVITIDSRKINLDAYHNYVCRVNGQSKPDPLGTDNAVALPDLEEYLIAATTMRMASLMSSTDKGLDPKFYMYRDIVRGGQGNDGLEAYIVSYPRGKKVG